jgi:hypothetical protein
MFTSPKSYNEMLPKLNLVTALSTFGYVFVLAALGYIPKLEMNRGLIPPLEQSTTNLVNWALSFGIIPIASMIVAYIFSSSFEMHNILSKLIGLRYFWDRFFIVGPLREIARSDVHLNRTVVRRVMGEFYYKELKSVDSHFVELFWRYALNFWIFFEHAAIVGVSLAILGLLKGPGLRPLLWYWAAVIAFAAAQFLLVVVRKTSDEIKQIPSQRVMDYFKSLSPIARL